MMALPRSLTQVVRAVLRDEAGTTVIETAIVAPVLVLLALGTFDISRMIARQHELDVAGVDIEGIVLAVASGSGTDVTTIQSVLVNSLSLSASNVGVTKVYRCGTATTLVTSTSSCSTSDIVATYVKITLSDTVTPFWTRFGIGGPMNYNVVRTVQVS